MNIVNLAQIQNELVNLLFQQLKYVLWAESFAAVCTVAGLWGSQHPLLLMTWLVVNLILCGLARHLMIYFYHQSLKQGELSHQATVNWLMIFSIGAFVSGVIWGTAGFILIPTHDILRQAFLIIMLAGVCAGANPIYSPYWQSYILFLLPAFLPVTIWMGLQGGIMSLLGLLGVVYIIILAASSWYVNHLIYTSLLLGFENIALVFNLSEATKKLETRSRELEKSLSMVNATLESTTDAILVVDSKNNIESFNKNFIDMWKVPLSIIHGKNANQRMIQYGKSQVEDPETFVDRIKKLHDNPEIESFDEIVFKDGRVIERFSKPQKLDNKFVGRVWSYRDITSRKLMETKLYKQANYDTLTGLPSRMLSQERLSQAMHNANQQKTKVAILFVDLDRFKMINDTLGHLIGDKILKMVAERLLSCVKSNDTVSRVGGDEFLVILHSINHKDEAVDVANKCIQAFMEPFVVDDNKFTMGLSIGISLYPENGIYPEILIYNADIAMYKAKEMGSNTFLCFTEDLNFTVQTRLQIENKLRDALLHQELSVLYQPVVSLQTGRIIGSEALMRWDHPTLGSVSPDEFISVAEESGVIVSIGEWILRTACEQTYVFHQLGFHDLYVSVNLSARQFHQSNLFEKIQAILQETGMNPGNLVFELTESLIMHNIDKNIDVLNQLKKIGTLLAMDDFGIGYSSLSYLKKLPIDKLKVDISFIKDIITNKDAATITAAIVTLAKKLGLKVIAEGVENEEQLAFLVEHHCDAIQGFYVSKPLDRDAYAKLLEQNPLIRIPPG